jgi:hypothetical protein
MNTDNTQDGAEPSLASAGSRGEPFAWAAECVPGAWSFTHMRHVASRWPQSETIPLYSQPQPTLTDEEREAIEAGICLCEGVAGEANENANANAWAKTAGRLRELLVRTK